ncbi:amino acid adenylation domain-containing protein, partial [Kitasatospora sp. NPDC093550]|uniref:non-ribosomal peptide synthetase n=1 Tax=Kitasatospora sp. NPDC093550 TaxID=3364089 RepID=UPI0038241ACB
HQDLPFEHLVELLQPERDLSRNPLAQVTFQLVNAADPAIELAGCEVERFEQVEQTNRFDLSMDVVDEPEALWGWINYSTDLFDASTMERLIARFLRVLDTVATDPSTPVSALPLLDATERHQVLEGFQPAALPVRPEAAHQLFEQHAARVPDSTALVFGEQRWTFAELNTRANRLAHRLIATGIGPDSRVALCAERHPNVVAAILAVWKAGAAYVPLDPAHPVARLDDLVADAAPDVLLVDPAQAERLAPHPHTLLLDDTHADESDHNPNLPVHPSQLAYVIYTSGSTGKPKGVQIEHGSLANLIAAERPRPAGDPSRPVRAAHTAPFGFDASVDQLCWLLNGHELHLVPDEVRRDTHALAALVREQAVDVLSVTPAQLELLLSLGLFGEHDGHRPEFVMVGGEAISPALWTAMRGTTGTRFFNLYGPTECTVDTTLHLLDTTRDRPSIGRPLPNTRVYVMDRHGTPAPLGVPGELWIGGAGVARGYWNRPELTAQRFTEDPFLPAERVYRTGDLGRWNPDGTLDFHGRIDDQVKIRGHRVEPGEVAAVLAEHPGVREAAVIARSDDGQPARLLAYAVPAARGADEAPATTRDKVEQWRDVFQTTHAEAGTADATFDIAGWTSSYTGGPIPAEEMRDWVDETVARIRALRPRRVLEIGAGTGLLLWRLAPQCERYVGTDFSASTLAGLAARLADRPIDGVELVHREANDLTGFEPGSFDCVVVNSVVQYFPHEAYLREVLAGARALLAPGGRIFVGDVRHLGLLDSFHHGVALARLGDGSPRRLHQDFLRRREQEGELVLSPAWFEEFAAQERLPGITVAPKAGRFDNELSRYRYDVVLSTDPADAARPADPAGATDPSGPARPAEGWRDWVAERLTLAEAEALLARDGLLRLTRVPNALVAGSAREAALLLGEDVAPGATVEAVRPVDLAELAARHGLEVALSWRADHPEGAFDAVLGGAPEDRRFPAPEARPAAGRTANDPVSTESSAVLGQELREYLAARLPEYLVPQAVVCLPALPLTVNGKLKKDELPVPGVAVGSVAPSTPVQELLATVWGEVLHLTGVGVRDNFFDLGGNSLVATRVIARAAQAGIRIGLRDVFQHQTIEELATACRPARPGKDD